MCYNEKSANFKNMYLHHAYAICMYSYINRSAEISAVLINVQLVKCNHYGKSTFKFNRRSVSIYLCGICWI